jgi:hypothetical protein
MFILNICRFFWLIFIFLFYKNLSMQKIGKFKNDRAKGYVIKYRLGRRINYRDENLFKAFLKYIKYNVLKGNTLLEDLHNCISKNKDKIKIDYDFFSKGKIEYIFFLVSKSRKFNKEKIFEIDPKNEFKFNKNIFVVSVLYSSDNFFLRRDISEIHLFSSNPKKFGFGSILLRNYLYYYNNSAQCIILRSVDQAVDFYKKNGFVVERKNNNKNTELVPMIKKF